MTASQTFPEAIPFSYARGLVEVDVILNGLVTGRFGLDTGADQLYIDKGFAERNNLPYFDSPTPRTIVSVAGRTSASPMEIQSLDIGSERLIDLSALAIDIDALANVSDGDHPDGLIGYDLLRKYCITVDYTQNTIALHMGKPSFTHDSRHTAIPFTEHNHLILVDVRLNDSCSGKMMVDLCSSYTLISPETAIKLGLKNDDESLQSVSSISLGKNAASTDVPVVVSDLKNFQSSHLKLAGILGASFLKGHVVTIDCVGKTIYVHH